MAGGMYQPVGIFLVSAANESSRHLLTGTGAYMYITWGIWLRHCLNGRQEEYRCKWRRIYHFPEIIRVEKGIPKPVVGRNSPVHKVH